MTSLAQTLSIALILLAAGALVGGLCGLIYALRERSLRRRARIARFIRREGSQN
jgi:hypothetical protein